MKHSSIIIFFALALSFVASCHWNPYDEKLAAIDSLTLSNPDSAIGLLSGIDVADFSDANRFYYDMLCLKAVDKAGYTIPSDSGVVDMVSYFESHDERKLAEAYYYAAKAYQGMNDAPQAIAYFQKVLDQPLDSTDKLLSNALFHSGCIFRQQFLRDESVDMFERSYRCDSIRKDTAAMIDNLQHIAYALGMNHYTPGLMDSVVMFHNKAKNLASQSDNIKKKASCDVYLSSAYCNTGNLALGEEYLDSAELHIKSIDNFDMGFFNVAKAQLAFNKKDYAEAESVSLELLQSKDMDKRQFALYYLSMIAAAHHNTEDIDRYFPRYKEVTDSIDLVKASEATANVNALYNYQLRERENLRLQVESQSRLYAIVILVAVTIAMALAFFVYRLKREKEFRIVQGQMARLKKYQQFQDAQKAEAADAEAQSITTKIANLEIEKSMFYKSKFMSSEAYKAIQQRLSDEKPMNAADVKLLDETVNAIAGGFKETLYSACSLSRQEYCICLLLKFGFSNREISVLLARSVSAISMARKRLFVKLFGKEGSAAELDDYIRSL